MSLLLGGTAKGTATDFGDEVHAEPVAWHLMKVTSERTITIMVPQVVYCLVEPRLEAVVEEEESRIVIATYLLRGIGPEARCRKVKTRRKKINFDLPIHDRRLFDGRFTPPRLRTLLLHSAGLSA